MFKSKFLKISEKDIQTTIMDYLDKKNIFHYRQNSGAMVTNYKGRKGFYKFASMNGLPDIVAIINGQYIGIECKAKYGQVSVNQMEFARRLEKAGGRYLVVHSLEELIKELI